MKKIILLISIILVTVSLFAADYCTGTVKNNAGDVEEAGVYMCFEYGGNWYTIDSASNDPVTGYYCLCFDDDETRSNIRISAYIQDHDVTLHEYRTYSGGNITVNFVYDERLPD